MSTIVLLLLKLAVYVVEYLARQRQLAEAEKKVLAELYSQVAKLVEKADEASSGVSGDPDDIVSDAANRDRRTG